MTSLCQTGSVSTRLLPALLIALLVGEVRSAGAWQSDTVLPGDGASLLGSNSEYNYGSFLVCVGDANGDSYLDFVVGAPEADFNGTDSGTVYLSFGGPTGWVLDMAPGEIEWYGEADEDNAGSAISSGDFDGDGFEDIAIGAWGHGENGVSAGVTYVIEGRAAGWPDGVSLAHADATFDGLSGTWVGYSVAGLLDINGDSYDELLISEPLAYINGAGHVGQVHLFYGNADCWNGGMDVGYSDVVFQGEQVNDHVGYSLAGIGDVNGDGVADFSIGAPLSPSPYNDGLVYVVFGEQGGWPSEVELAAADASFVGERSGSAAGQAISPAGDVDGDGFDDFLIGAPLDDEVATSAGQVYLVLGRATGWSIGTSLAVADASFLPEGGGDSLGW